eukprot:6187659-Pleurochrysis_carterae.AAC.3
MAPPQLTPKAQMQPARDKASDPDRTFWHKNPISNEPNDPANCLKTVDLDVPEWILTDTNADNTSTPAVRAQNSTPKQNNCTVEIGQKPSPDAPFTIRH